MPALGRRAFLTTGRMGLAAFADVADVWFLVRSVDPPEPPCPPRMEVLLDRGPFTLDGEREVLRAYGIDVLVTKDSGGAATAPKLVAAREAGIPVVIVRRPRPPTGCRSPPPWRRRGVGLPARRGEGRRRGLAGAQDDRVR